MFFFSLFDFMLNDLLIYLNNDLKGIKVEEEKKLANNEFYSVEHPVCMRHKLRGILFLYLAKKIFLLTSFFKSDYNN